MQTKRRNQTQNSDDKLGSITRVSLTAERDDGRIHQLAAGRVRLERGQQLCVVGESLLGL
jgi:hypothetical protein